MSGAERRQQTVLKLLIVLMTMTIVSFWMLGNLYAKYVTQGSGADSARVAVFQISDSDDLNASYEINPSLTGEKQQKIEIKVTNSSEVALRYSFSFDMDGNLPVEIEGAAPDGITMTKKTAENTWTADRAAVSGNAVQETYTFTLSLDNTEENYQYAGGVERLRLHVRAEQID